MIYTPFTVKLEPLLKFSDENICLPWLKLWVPSAAWSGLGVGRAQNTLNGFWNSISTIKFQHFLEQLLIETNTLRYLEET